MRRPQNNSVKKNLGHKPMESMEKSDEKTLKQQSNDTKKTLTVLGRYQDELRGVEEQLFNIFGNRIVIESHKVSNLPRISISSKVTLVLLGTRDFVRIPAEVFRDCKVVFARRTISTTALEQLRLLPENLPLYFLDREIERAEHIIKNLWQIGFQRQMLPVTTKEANQLGDGVCVVTMGYNGFVEERLQLVDIGPALLDLTTLLDMGIMLGMEEFMSNRNLVKSSGTRMPQPISPGVEFITGSVNQISGQQEIVMAAVEEGIISTDNNGWIGSTNRHAEDICRMTANRMAGKDIRLLLPEIPFEEAMTKLENINERIIKLGGDDVIVSVRPTIRSSNVYGAIVMLKRFSEMEKRQHDLRARLLGKGHVAKYQFSDIVGDSEKIRTLKEIAKRMAKSDSTILITGETGTGKELFAQAIHNSSARSEYQFVAINCGALPENLLESELFGYEEGAFTGAKKSGKIGMFELAHKGTMFLDEIGDMPFNLQLRLLRVLQERQVMRLGGDRLINIDVRLIAATNADLWNLVEEGKFRSDLYYRINVLPLHIPPLRERSEDIEPIIGNLKKSMNARFTFTEDAMEILKHHAWKGNIRELRNYIEYLANVGKTTIEPEDLPIRGSNEKRLEKKFIYPQKPDLNEAFFSAAGKNKEKYLFVLKELEQSMVRRERAGRRSLSERAAKGDYYLSEQEIRTILVRLEAVGLVQILRGRGGSFITEEGRRLLRQVGM